MQLDRSDPATARVTKATGVGPVAGTMLAPVEAALERGEAGEESGVLAATAAAAARAAWS